MEPLVDSVGESDDSGEPREPVGQRSPGPAARTPRPPTGDRLVRRVARTLLVDSADPAAYAEIDAAIAAADDGDRVLVRPGTYRAPVVVDRAIELVGDGPCEAIVLEPAGAEALSLCASGAIVRNLTIRPAAAANDGAIWSAIWVRDVIVTIEDCDLSSHLGATVWVGGRSSRATIRRCVIHDGAQNGVAAWDEGTAIVEESELVGHRWPAVMASGLHSNASVRACRIVDNFDIGAAAVEGASLTVQRTLLARNARDGAALVDAAPSSRIEDSEIEENGNAGIVVHGGVGGHVEENRLRRNGLGVLALDGASPRVTRNEIVDCLGPAVVVAGDRSDPAVSDNVLVATRSAAVVVNGGAAGRFERNRIRAGQQPGAWVQEERSSPSFLDNTITGSALVGIAVTGGAGGCFEGNDLRGNKGGAWDLREAGPVELRGNLEDPRPTPKWPDASGYVH